MGQQSHTIGLIFPELVDFGDMCWGAFDAAEDYGANAVCFQGNPLHSPIGFSAHANLLYDLISAETPIDGLVMWTGWLGQFVGAEEAARFCERFAPLPIVSISQRIAGIPCVLGDNTRSMRDIVRHLVEVHDCQRLALVTGPPNHLESAERYQAYRMLLAQYGMTFDPDLVVSAQFTQEAGVAAMHQLLDQRGTSFDAVITGDDFVALGVVEGLMTRGIRVPEDVAVIGFDDTPHASATIPPLTTVRQSAYDQGYQGAKLLLARLHGEDTPMQVNLPMRLIVRQSCGCSNPVVLRAVASTVASTQTEPSQQFWLELGQQREHIIETITQAVSDVADTIQPSHVEQVCDAFAAELTGHAPYGFMHSMERILREISATHSHVFVCQDLISAMRQTILPLISDREQIILATNLWGQSRVLIGETALRIQAQNHLKVQLQTRLLREIGQEFITTFDLEGLITLLGQELPKIGITGCWLALYNEQPEQSTPEKAVLVAGFEGNQTLNLPANGHPIAANSLVLDWLTQRQQPFRVILEPLYFRERQLGLVLFEPGPRDGTMYEVLRGYLTTALYGALLFQRNLDLYHQAVQARADAEKADELKTRLLANVSHDLRAPLNVILGYTETALTNPQRYGLVLPDELTHDIEHIRASAEYLVRIIGDLLDLSRAEINELDLYLEIIDPRAVLHTIFENMVESLPSSEGVAWRLCVPDHLPLIRVDPDRLRQILFNLLSNAHNYTPAGEITLGADVQPPHFHIWVHDTGIGIAPEHQEKIFEPFVTGGASRQGIGLGLSITRQLVSLHRGFMSLESNPGTGSTFHVYLPLPNLAGQTAHLAQTGQDTLLLLSSRRELLPAAADLAERHGWELIRITNDTIENFLVPNSDHDFVAIAWDLNPISPFDWALAEKIQTHPQLRPLPMLLFGTPDIWESHGTKPAETLVTQVMIKPFGGETLLQAMKRLLPEETSGVILAVDDDYEALNLYQRLIHHALPQYAIRLAHSGKEALEYLADDLVPALVILDLMMPETDGFEVLDLLRATSATRHVPVLILSGKVLSFEDIRRVSQHDVLLHTKNVLDDDELESVLRSLIDEGFELDRQTSELVKLALAYIHQNYGQPFSREDICQVLGISKNYLSRLFRQELGLTLKDYTNRYRMSIARQLLIDTSTPITDVAQRVGFDDPAYFSRVFTQATGVSPRAYRQTNTTTR